MRSLGGNQKMTIVNESGLYSLIFRSRKPEAKEFKKWVTTEVLPSIRKQGYYLSDSVKKQFYEHVDALEQVAKKELKHKDELMDMVFEAVRKMPDRVGVKV